MPDLADRLIGLVTDGVKYESKLRLAINSQSGDGKTLTSLALAKRLCEKIGPEAKILVADSEHQSALKYADIVPFKHLSMPDHHLDTYLALFDVAERLQEHYPVVLLIDSGSHSWNGKGGALEEVDAYAEAHRTSRGAKNTFNAWAPVRPKLNRFLDRINDVACHLIITYRLKKKNIQTTDADGRTKIESIGLEVVAQDMVEYEFDVVVDLTRQKEMVVTKTRCPRLTGMTFKPLAHVDPLHFDKEAGDSTIGMVDTLWAWLKGAPQRTAATAPQVSDPNLAFLALFDGFKKLGHEPAFREVMEKYGLNEDFSRMNLKDPALRERSVTAYKILKATLHLKTVAAQDADPAKPVESQPANVSTTAAEGSPTVVADTAQSTPTPESPAQPEQTLAPCVPINGQIRKLELSDFTNDELKTLHAAMKPVRARGWNRAALAAEILRWPGDRSAFLSQLNQELDAQGEN